jgi:hypothetical protein
MLASSSTGGDIADAADNGTNGTAATPVDRPPILTYDDANGEEAEVIDTTSESKETVRWSSKCVPHLSAHISNWPPLAMCHLWRCATFCLIGFVFVVWHC